MSKEEPEIIRLMDATGIIALDSVAAEYEDSFCLEAFGESIRMAEQAEPKGTKHFIIARVQTWDHKQPDRAFYSYYHAHHLNKLLFQTQVYLQKKLIHRLHVLNPLTNTDIIGNVLYFMVIGKSKRIKGGVFIKEPIGDQAPSTMRAAEVPNEELRIEPAALAVPPSPSVAKLPPFQDPIALNRAIHNKGPETILEEDEEEEDEDGEEGDVTSRPPKSPIKGDQGDIVKTGWTLTGTVTAEGDDVQEQQQSQNGEKRESIMGVVARRLSETAQKARGFMPLKDSDKEAGAGEFNELSESTNQQIAIDMNKTNGSSGKRLPANLRVQTTLAGQAGPRSALPGVNKSHNSPAVVNVPKSAFARTSFGADALMSPTTAQRIKNQTAVSAGTITQRGERLTPVQAMAIVPPSARSRRRSLSYMNAVQTSGSTNASIDDWKRAYTNDKQTIGAVTEEDKKIQASGKYDEVKPIDTTNTMSQNMKADEAMKQEWFYDAILIATDNDFLESSRVRTIFRENAVNTSDAALFEMPPYTGEQRVHRGPRHVEDTPLPCDCCFPTDEQLRNSPLWLRLFHECKCYMLLVVLTVALIAFISMAVSGGNGQPPPAR